MHDRTAPVSRCRNRLPWAATLAAAWGIGCGRPEPADVVRARSEQALLEGQISELHKVIARADAGRLVTSNRIAIGLGEEEARQALDAALPRQVRLKDRLDVRLDDARPIFRGDTAAVQFEAQAHDVKTGASAHLAIGGRLVDFRVARAHLAARVELVEFRVLDSTTNRFAANAIQRFVRGNRDALGALVPDLDLPVRLDQAIEFGALDDGVVRTRPGRLPLAVAVAEVLPFAGRLWVFVDLRAGPWQVGTQGTQGTR